MYDIDRKSCTACRKVGALHCSDPINCGQMKDEADNWMSWLDDLPVYAAFDEGIGCLQEYISALRAKLDAAEAEKRQAIEALIWCSGSQDFASEGLAREGWPKICQPSIAAATRTGAKP